MKTLFLMAALLLLSSHAFAAPKTENYAGTWTLDTKQSKNLPPFYSRVRSHKLIITQDEKHLNVAVEVSIGEAAPDKLSFPYNLDGSETKTETLIRTPAGPQSVPATLKAVVSADGRVHITITRELQMQGESFKGITNEDWELSADGKTLTIHRTDEMPRGKMQTEMVFVKS